MENTLGFLDEIFRDSALTEKDAELAWKANGHLSSSTESLRIQTLRAREALSNQRNRVLDTRVLAHQKRSQLRYQREELSGLEDKLSQALNHYLHRPEKGTQKTVLRLFQELQRSRNVFGPLENEYDQVENVLDQEEYKLEQDENRFYERYYAGLDLDAHLLQHAESVQLATEPVQSRSAGGAEVSSPRSPVIREYYSQLGHASFLMEKLGDLLLERSQVMEEETTRERRGLSPDRSHKEFWTFFDREWVQTLDELNGVEAAVEQSKRRAQEQGLLATENTSDASTDATIEADEGLGEPTDTWVEHLDPVAAKERLLSKPLSSRERVHYWLLSVMEASPHDMRLYRLRFNLDQEYPDDETFRRLILYDAPLGGEESTMQGLSSGSVSPSVMAYVSIHSDERSMPERAMPRRYTNGGTSTKSDHTEILLDIWSRTRSV